MTIAAALTLTGVVPITVRAQQAATIADPLVFDHVIVVDVEQGKLVPDQRVVVTGNRIRAVDGVGRVKLPRGAHIVDAGGKYLIPGLWDMHVHARDSIALFSNLLLLANGVTGFRDAGSGVPLATLLRWRREILAGTQVGPPRQILSGPYINDVAIIACPDVFSACVDGDSIRVRRLVDSIQEAGADMIKPRALTKEMYFVIAAEARRLGIPFGGHMQKVTAIEASDSGAAIIDHPGNGIRSGALDSLCLDREITASVARCQPVAERFRQHGTWWVPTLSGIDVGGHASRPVIERLHEFSSRFWQSDNESQENWLRRSLLRSAASSPVPVANSLGILRIMQRVGLPILAGTDMVSDNMRTVLPGFSLHAELAMYVAEGLTPLNALQSATLNPAKLLHATDSLGTVATGKLADLVLLDANPLEDITHTTLIRAVVANGRYFDRAALDALLIEVRAKAKAKLP